VFHQSAAALIFNSGYDANLGVLSCVPQKGDTIIYDSLCHASIRDGIRLSMVQPYSYIHNSVEDLEEKLQAAQGNIFVVTETVFSMDGDICPLKQLVDACKKYNAHLIIDEAHATGIIGDCGEGLVQKLQLQDEIFCRIHTFGKACGCHGAVILGSEQLKSYLVNFARSFVYSTSLPEHSVAMIQASYKTFPPMRQEREYLKELISIFQSSNIAYGKLPSQTPVQIVMVPGNNEVKELSEHLQQHNLDVRPILSPTVPKGKERLRVVLHAFNTKAELELLIAQLK
jgi:8-amino-7-oxononanoate synthase